METPEPREMLQDVLVTVLAVLTGSTLIVYFGQPVWLSVEQAIGTVPYIAILFSLFMWLGFGFKRVTEYENPVVLVGSSFVYAVWPTLIETMFGSSNSLLFLLSGIMWVGFVIGSVSPTIQARLTSGER